MRCKFTCKEITLLSGMIRENKVSILHITLDRLTPWEKIRSFLERVRKESQKEIEHLNSRGELTTQTTAYAFNPYFYGVCCRP